MRNLARLLVQLGFPVSGTDPRAADARDALAALGVCAHTEQDGSRIPADAQLVVATAALPADHAELAAARRRGLPVIKYARALAAVAARAESIAVAGTHGKTTTTALAVSALRAAGLDPGFLLGGAAPGLGGGADLGGGELFVAEACEHDRSFLELAPSRAVVLNIEADHLDVYGDLAAVREAFVRFTRRVRPGGRVAVPAGDAKLRRAAQEGRAAVVTFGFEPGADYRAVELVRTPAGSELAVEVGGAVAARLSLPRPGDHLVLDALGALAVCDGLAPLAELAAGLARFAGVRRRFEERGEADGVAVIDDYAHHPTELDALLDAVRARHPLRRLVLAFQPHQIERTRRLADGFAAALARADRVVITDIFAARDREGDDPSAAPLAALVTALGGDPLHAPGLDEAIAALGRELRAGDVLVTAGAGDVHRIADAFAPPRVR